MNKFAWANGNIEDALAVIDANLAQKTAADPSWQEQLRMLGSNLLNFSGPNAVQGPGWDAARGGLLGAGAGGLLGLGSGLMSQRKKPLSRMLTGALLGGGLGAGGGLFMGSFRPPRAPGASGAPGVPGAGGDPYAALFSAFRTEPPRAPGGGETTSTTPYETASGVIAGLGGADMARNAIQPMRRLFQGPSWLRNLTPGSIGGTQGYRDLISAVIDNPNAQSALQSHLSDLQTAGTRRNAPYAELLQRGLYEHAPTSPTYQSLYDAGLRPSTVPASSGPLGRFLASVEHLPLAARETALQAALANPSGGAALLEQIQSLMGVTISTNPTTGATPVTGLWARMRSALGLGPSTTGGVPGQQIVHPEQIRRLANAAAPARSFRSLLGRGTLWTGAAAAPIALGAYLDTRHAQDEAARLAQRYEPTPRQIEQLRNSPLGEQAANPLSSAAAWHMMYTRGSLGGPQGINNYSDVRNGLSDYVRYWLGRQTTGPISHAQIENVTNGILRDWERGMPFNDPITRRPAGFRPGHAPPSPTPQR